MADTLHGGNDAQVKRVARVVGKGAHAALTEDDLVVAFAHDVFGGHEELVERGRHTAFDQDRLAGPAGFLQQREVLHVASADLDDVGVLFHQFQGLFVEGFGDNAHAGALADFGHDFEAFEAEPLEGVGRGAGLEGAAAEELRARGGDQVGDGVGLLAALDGTGTGDYGHGFAAADGGVCAGEVNDGVFFFDVAAGQLVGLRDADDFGDSGEELEIASIHFALIAGDSDGGALCSGQSVCAKAQLFNMIANCLDLFRRRLRFHDD